MVWNAAAVQGVALQRTEADYVREQSENVSVCLREINQEANQLAAIITGDEAAAEACATGDGARLEEILQPLYKQWQQRFGVAELSLISADGRAVWSSREDIKAGDDMSYQRVVGKALLGKESLSAPESDGDNTLLVTTRPLFKNHTYIGLCKVSISVAELGSKLQKSGSGKFAFYHLNGVESTFMWGNKQMQPSLNTADIKKLQEGGVISRRIAPNRHLLFVPLQDIDGVTVAYLQNLFDLQSFFQAKLCNYLTLPAALILAVMAIYVRGRRKSDCDHDHGEGYANMSKISSVAFNIDTDKSRQNAGKEQ